MKKDVHAYRMIAQEVKYMYLAFTYIIKIHTHPVLLSICLSDALYKLWSISKGKESLTLFTLSSPTLLPYWRWKIHWYNLPQSGWSSSCKRWLYYLEESWWQQNPSKFKEGNVHLTTGATANRYHVTTTGQLYQTWRKSDPSGNSSHSYNCKNKILDKETSSTNFFKCCKR